jgi:uncharacterized protein
MSIIKIKEHEFDLLYLQLKNHLLPNNEVENILYKYSLINLNLKKNKKNSPQLLPITNIALFVTQKCNLNCVYCYGNQGKYGGEGIMSNHIAFKAIDWLIEKSQNQKKLTISFFGGEPLLNFELIKSVVEYSLKKGDKLSKDFEFNINTNATLLNDEIINFFLKNRFKIIVSIDGDKEIQDSQRPFKNGKGTFNTILPRVKKLLLSIPDVSCRAVLLDNTNPSIVEKKLQEIGFQKILTSYSSLSLFNSKEENKVNKRDLNQFFQKIREEAECLDLSIKERDNIKLENLKNTGILFSRFNRLVNGQKKLFPCGAGRSSVALSCKGDVFLCHRFVGTEDFKIGNISRKNLEIDKYQVSPLEIRNSCKNCFAKFLCAGGCYHDNLGYSGSIYKPSSDMCELMKYLVSQLLIVYSRLTKNDLNYLYEKSFIDKKICPFDF